MTQMNRFTHPALNPAVPAGGDGLRDRTGWTARAKAHAPYGRGSVARVVGDGDWVTYKISSGPEQSGLISSRARDAMVEGVIPQGSPLGVALTGLRVGMRAPLPCADGSVASVTVVKIDDPT